MNKLDVGSLAWVAGLLEGEGCFSLYRPKNRLMAKVGVICKTIDRDTIGTLQKLTGVGRVYQEREKMGKHGNPLPILWSWELRPKKEVESLCRAILPFMSARRSAKIKKILDFCAENPLWGHEQAEIGSRFQQTCLDTQARLKKSNRQIGALLEVTGATFSRWKNGVVQPPVHKRQAWEAKLTRL